jgi:hypothetical protein
LICPQNHQHLQLSLSLQFHSSKACALQFLFRFDNCRTHKELGVYEVFHRIAISAFLSLLLQLNCNVCSHFFTFAIEMQMVATDHEVCRLSLYARRFRCCVLSMCVICACSFSRLARSHE